MKVFWLIVATENTDADNRFFRTEKARDVYQDKAEREGIYILNDGSFDVAGVTNIKFTEVADAN